MRIMTHAQLNKNFVRIVSHSAHIVLKRVYDDRLQYNTKVSDMLLFLGFTTIIKFVSNFIRAEDWEKKFWRIYKLEIVFFVIFNCLKFIFASAQFSQDYFILYLCLWYKTIFNYLYFFHSSNVLHCYYLVIIYSFYTNQFLQ